MSGYLLDTNICIFFNKGVAGLRERLIAVGLMNCAISEITQAELLYGVEKSMHRAKNMATLEEFITDLQIIPVSQAIPLFASEKARLAQLGKPIDNFDLLIGATAIIHEMTLVTNNTKHIDRLHGITLEDWTK